LLEGMKYRNEWKIQEYFERFDQKKYYRAGLVFFHRDMNEDE